MRLKPIFTFFIFIFLFFSCQQEKNYPQLFNDAHELLAALGCQVTGETGHTSVPEIFAAGDCTGLGGAPAAEAEGIIAGLAAAASLGFPADPRAKAKAQRMLKHHRAFQRALWTLFAAEPVAAPGSDTIICRCEGLHQAELAAGRAAGYADANALKRLTRAGMGRCQGRYCGALMQDGRAPAAGFTPRPPAKPVRIGEIL